MFGVKELVFGFGENEFAFGKVQFVTPPLRVAGVNAAPEAVNTETVPLPALATKTKGVDPDESTAIAVGCCPGTGIGFPEAFNVASVFTV